MFVETTLKVYLCTPASALAHLHQSHWQWWQDHQRPQWEIPLYEDLPRTDWALRFDTWRREKGGKPPTTERRRQIALWDIRCHQGSVAPIEKLESFCCWSRATRYYHSFQDERQYGCCARNHLWKGWLQFQWLKDRLFLLFLAPQCRDRAKHSTGTATSIERANGTFDRWERICKRLIRCTWRSLYDANAQRKCGRWWTSLPKETSQQSQPQT